MNIGVVNGSPRGKNSNSENVLEELKKILEGENIIEFYFNTPKVKEEDLNKFKDIDALIIAFPLYVDCLPSHLLNCLKIIEDCKIDKNIKIYAACNSGFFEGIQSDLALDIIKNWCKKAGFSYMEGIGIGGGGMIKNIPFGKGPRKNISMALNNMAKDILELKGNENVFVQPVFPRMLYKFIAEIGWRKMIKSNGMKGKDLFRV